ncbi:hypothetical protein AB4851_33330 [Burkholderia sp. 22PA0099]|uniref:hypothetical protein n=1 Tax=unclassified Burkholderia TaxID=2613784 RepID=UPI0039C465FE
MTTLGVGLFRQIGGLHRHAEFILAHGYPASKVERRRHGAAPGRRQPARTGSAFCLMRPTAATAGPRAGGGPGRRR